MGERLTPREARERFEEQLTRQMKGIFRDFEAFLRDKYGLQPVDEVSPVERAQQLTERFNRFQGSSKS